MKQRQSYENKTDYYLRTSSGTISCPGLPQEFDLYRFGPIELSQHIVRRFNVPLESHKGKAESQKAVPNARITSILGQAVYHLTFTVWEGFYIHFPGSCERNEVGRISNDDTLSYQYFH